jgi:hypothetical protein
MSKPSAVAVVGDLHTGSTVGLISDYSTNEEGAPIGQSPFQKWLWACWLEYCDWLNNFEIDALIINGDLVQGVNGRDSQLATSNEAVMKQLCIDVLQPLVCVEGTQRTKNIYITRGTGFHSGGGGSREETIGEAIGAHRDSNKQYSRWANWLSWRGKVLHATHHISVAAVYPLTPLYRAQREMRERAQRGYPMPDVDVRSHVHTCHMYEATDNKWIVTAPAWQGMTEFSHKVAPASIPTIGGLVLCLENERVEIKRKLFPSSSPVLMEVI